MNKLQLSRLLMTATLLLLAAFEGYWLHKLYGEENRGLRNGVEVAFRGAIDRLQRRIYEKDASLMDQAFVAENKSPVIALNKKSGRKGKDTPFIFRYMAPATTKALAPDMIQSIIVESSNGFQNVPPPGLVEMMLKKKAGMQDSGSFKKDMTTVTIRLRHMKDSLLSQKERFRDSIGRIMGVQMTSEPKRIIQEPSPIIHFLKTNKTLNDSIPVARVDSAYKEELSRVINQHPPYSIVFKCYRNTPLQKSDFEKDSTREVTTSKVFIGYSTPYSYQAHFGNVEWFILNKMRMQIGGSVLLLVLVLISFIVLYRNLLAQQKLADIKNDFISNITHELKTPIATVAVAIEALRNFNAIQSPERTKEYLDISASELQRLSLLVDKVLKISLFESKRVELKKEHFDMKALVEETMNTMRLQFEKQGARVSFTAEGGPFEIEADKLHITSVIYNLLDNALKYSREQPEIQVSLRAVQENIIELKVSDNGVGIAPQYQAKVFDKFFRVPMGNQHTIKGYGLGLSYVSEIVKRHMGYVVVESVLDKGSTFTVKLPIEKASEIRFDKHRVIRKKIL